MNKLLLMLSIAILIQHTPTAIAQTQNQDSDIPQIGGGYTYLGELENTDRMYAKLGNPRKRYGYTEVPATVRVIEQSTNPRQTSTSMVVNCDRREIILKTIHRFTAEQNIDFQNYGAGIVKPVVEGRDSYAIWDYACGNK